MFDMEKQSFSEMFAAYDDSPEYKGKPGFGIDLGLFCFPFKFNEKPYFSIHESARDMLTISSRIEFVKGDREYKFQ